MKNRIAIFLGAAWGTTLTGCATTPGQCDPKSVDFFKNTSCLASGAYGERQRDMQATLSIEQNRNAAFKAVLAELEAEQTRVKGQLKTRQADYARLDGAWRKLKQSLADEMQSSRSLARRVDQIDSGVKARAGSDGTADAAAKRATRDQLQRQIQLLEKELDAGVYR